MTSQAILLSSKAIKMKSR